jgi:hypothetical protein
VALFVFKDSPIKTFADIKGRRIVPGNRGWATTELVEKRSSSVVRRGATETLLAKVAGYERIERPDRTGAAQPHGVAGSRRARRSTLSVTAP